MLPAQGKAALRDSLLTSLPLQAPAGQGTQRSSGELKCGHEVPGPSLMKQFTMLPEIIPELFWCPVYGQQLPVDPSPMPQAAPEAAGTP